MSIRLPSYSPNPSHRTAPRTSTDEQLPAYSKNAKACTTHVTITEREAKTAVPKKESTLRSILTGSVHKHNARYVLGDSVTAAAPAPQKKSEAERDQSSSASSTLRSILTGDVHEYNARYRLEESVSERQNR
ncbi:hypothetical protein LTR39_000590 [Cryomyces antarcticus]|nr:hypothetical protein LTR39_000590 [Cryomyces antarcticus]